MPASSIEPRVVQLLSSHWCANPLASDTPDGMHRWWLPASHEFTLEQIDAALAWMVRRGLVLENTTADGRIRYCRSPSASQAELERLAAGVDVLSAAGDAGG